MIGIFESKMSGFMLHLGPYKICFSIDSFYLKSLVLYFLQDSLFYMALSRLNFTMLFGVSEIRRLSCAWVLLALLLFFIDCLSRLMLPDIHTPKVTRCCAWTLRWQSCEPPNSSDALFSAGAGGRRRVHTSNDTTSSLSRISLETLDKKHDCKS